MKKYILLPLFLALTISCSNTTKNFGAYSTAYIPKVQNLKPTRKADVYVSKNQEQYAQFNTYFTSMVKDKGWKVIGTATISGSFYSIEYIENLATTKGSNHVWLHIARTPRIKQHVAYGSYTNYYYPTNPYVAPIIPPYQVAPARGGFGGLMDYSLKQEQLYQQQMRSRVERERIDSIRQAQWQQDQQEWTQWLVFYRDVN